MCVYATTRQIKKCTTVCTKVEYKNKFVFTVLMFYCCLLCRPLLTFVIICVCKSTENREKKIKKKFFYHTYTENDNNDEPKFEGKVQKNCDK